MPFQFRKEAIEEDLNRNFPSQGQGNPPLYYSLSEVVVPTYSVNSVAEGSGLPENLQTAWDFSTGSIQVSNSTYQTVINNTGFWLIDLSHAGYTQSTPGTDAIIRINDGASTKNIWARPSIAAGGAGVVVEGQVEARFVVFLRSGDTLEARAQITGADKLDIWYRQIATLNGQLINPLGFSFA